MNDSTYIDTSQMTDIYEDLYNQGTCRYDH